MSSLRALLAMAALLASSTALVPARAQESGIAVGTKAPPASVERLDGAKTDLSAYFGTKPVLIEFWATWCPNCKQLEPAMIAAHKKYESQVQFVCVAVSVNQSPERVKLYAAKYGLKMDMLYDRKGAATDAYDVPATSYVVVVDRTGKVVYTGLGGDQNLEEAIRRAL
jgi:peroxiredoxin